MKKLIVLTLFLTACGPKYRGNVQPANSSSPELQVWVNDFETRYNLKVGFPVYIGNGLGENIVAVCRVWTGGEREVQINTKSYEEYKDNYYFMQQTVYHELGHCQFNLGHTDTILSDGKPKSIMFPYAFGDTLEYINNLSYYFSELYYQATGLNVSFKTGQEFVDIE